MKQPTESIAENLRAMRESRGLSFEQLSDLTGVSKSMLRQIENGKSSPTISTIWKIANGLRVSFTSLLCRPPVRAEVKSFHDEPPPDRGGKAVSPVSAHPVQPGKIL